MNPEDKTEMHTSAQELWEELLKLGVRFTSTWTLYQVIIIIFLAVFCTLITRAFMPKCAKWCEGKEGVYKHLS